MGHDRPLPLPLGVAGHEGSAVIIGLNGLRPLREVVQPSAEGRKNGGPPVWLGLVNGPDATTDTTAWIKDSGPGLTGPSDILDLYAFRPSRRIRAELHDDA
ncbi:hypothetical protein ACFYUJ_27160 [Streptomyces sp. NPDC004520]|uniref:hypothetical protein n=1 Tax=Streptomyces sp. NPDC004520 TaxID=3364702 RepID=UPI0036CF203C